uniref:Uncharacterized protein n=1 Tax=viral metagenome TaxID=1070528 RepID=A0A6C0M370_9ZZZZ
MADFSLEDLVNMKLDDAEEVEYIKKPYKRSKKHSKKPVIEDSESEPDYVECNKTKKKSGCMISSKIREILIIYILFIFFSSKFATGQADRIMRIQVQDYSIYDLLVRGIVMVLLFFIFCRLFK